MTEANLLKHVLLRVNALGARLFRNQVGQYQLADGRWLRSGLCKGSSDLIGWTSVKVTPAMVGQHIAVFTAVEVKAANGRVSDEQRLFVSAVQNNGGIACVAFSVDDVARAVGAFK